MSNKFLTPISGSGDVVGPASSTNNGICSYADTTGKLIKDSAVTLDGGGIDMAQLDIENVSQVANLAGDLDIGSSGQIEIDQLGAGDFLIRHSGVSGDLDIQNTNGRLLLQSAIDSPDSILINAVNLVGGIEITSGIGTTMDNKLDITHTVSEDNDHALKINCLASGFADVKALDIVYNTGNMQAGDTEAGVLINIDESGATDGRVVGMIVLTTNETPAVEKDALGVGVQVNPVIQSSGVLINADVVLVNVVDETTDLSTGGGGLVNVFLLDNDTMTIEGINEFSEIQVLLDTVSSGAGIQPLFEFSSGSGPTTYTAFSPIDGTNQMRNSGTVSWKLGDIPGWVVGDSTNFEIRITRQRNTLSTTPICDKIQIVESTVYSWDKDGDLTIATLDSQGSNPFTLSTSSTSGVCEIRATQSIKFVPRE